VSYFQTAAQDYKVVDGAEDVTFVSKGSPNVTLNLTHCFAEDLTVHELAVSGGFLSMSDKRWYLPAEQIPAGNAPKTGDSIAAGGVTFVVIDKGVSLDPLKVCWCCVTRKAR
jgi:hypothetical protein